MLLGEGGGNVVKYKFVCVADLTRAIVLDSTLAYLSFTRGVGSIPGEGRDFNLVLLCFGDVHDS